MSNQNAVEKGGVANDGSYKMKQASCYGLEYSTALFMNLCLHRSGKEKCLPMAKLVLQIFTHLLNTDVKQVIFHRNYSLILIRRKCDLTRVESASCIILYFIYLDPTVCQWYFVQLIE